MKILVNDYGAYAFPFELSQCFARRGHTVVHAYCDSLDGTPNGCFVDESNRPETLTLRPLKLRQRQQKQSLLKRRRQDIEYGGMIVQTIRDARPDVVLSGNTPLDAQAKLTAACKRESIATVFWLQDVLSHAIRFGLKRKLGPLGLPVAAHYRKRERDLIRQSDQVVSITADFEAWLDEFGIPKERRAVIENWAPLNEFPMLPKDNDWSRSRGIHDTLTFMYSGTLSLKHNPDRLIGLARTLRPHGGNVWVRSVGSGADYLTRCKGERDDLQNLHIEGFGPFAETPSAYASADVLVALLENEASHFSVPSKVLSYLCAGRPLLLAVPEENLAAKIVRSCGGGRVVSPEDEDGFLSAGDELARDPKLRQQLGNASRQYAERTFDIEVISDRFLEIFRRAIEG
ncbi:MAG: glycosyltransferase family 4 protein [Planctomycetota bacterium]